MSKVGACPKEILIVDDHPILREGIMQVLEAEGDLAVAHSVGTAEEAFEYVKTTHPDLVLTDLTLPGNSGLELVKNLKAFAPDLPVLVMSMHDETTYAERVIKAGGRGYLMKEEAASSLVAAIRKVLDGDIYMSEPMTARLLQRLLPNQHDPGLPIDRLSDRELEVFELLGNGKTSSEISERLSLSPRTIDAHRANIREKLGAKNSTELVRDAIRWIETGGKPG